MISFLEFNLTSGIKITVNINHITNFFQTASSSVIKICMGDEDVFSVIHSYEDVSEMIKSLSDVNYKQLLK